MESPAIQGIDWLNPDYQPVYAERVERLRRIRAAGPEQLARLHDYYAENPIDWIRDWGHTFDPRRLNQGEPALRPMIPFPRQVELLDFIHRCEVDQEDGVVEKTREVGVSWCAIHYAVWMWLYKPGAVVGCGSYEAPRVDVLGVVDSLLEKARVIIRHLPPELRPAGLDTSEGGHLLHKRLLNPTNGAQIVGEVGDQIGRGGRASMYVVDEYAFLKHHQLVDSALSSTTNCRIYISTPYGLGAFYEKTQSDAFRHFRFEWRQDPRKNDAWYTRFRRKFGPTITAREVDIDHHASVENCLIESQWIEAAQALEAALRDRGVSLPTPGRLPGVAGLDVGGGKAPSVFVARHGPWLSAPHAWKDMEGDTTLTGQRALALARRARCSRLLFDAPGVGKGVASALRRASREDRLLPPREPERAEPERPGGSAVDQLFARAAAEEIPERPRRGAGPEPALGGGELIRCRGVNTGSPASESTRLEDGRSARDAFKNLKAQIWWATREAFRASYETWLWATDQPGGHRHPIDELILLPREGVEQLKRELIAPQFFYTTTGKVRVESKDELSARGVKSPDQADALVLTYAPIKGAPRAEKMQGYW